MRLLAFIFLISFHYNVLGQDCGSLTNKQKRVVKKAQKYIAERKLYDAREVLSNRKLIPEFLALKSEVYWLMGDYYNAKQLALEAIDYCPDNFPKVYYILGEISFDLKDYVASYFYLKKSILDKNLSYYPDAFELNEKAKVLADIINNPVPYNPIVLKGVSTHFDEYLPVISPDQELTFFTRRSLKKTLQSITETSVEEFVSSAREGDLFGEGVALPDPFNKESNEGGASITIDNKVLYYTKCIRDRSGYNNCDIYYVNKELDAWSVVQKFSNNISNPNSWESQPSVSSDGKTIIFASDREGGYGKIDLYEINFVEGEWTAPVNLGPVINSDGHEKSPYLHTDGKTLFFASTNFPSLGGFDIFYSRKDSLGDWEQPKNIGYPINTESDEISLFVSTDGNTAYFASNQLEGVGGWDIYYFPLYDAAKPNRVLFLKGELVDDQGRVLEDTEIEIKNLKTKEVTLVKVEKGAYVSSLTLGKDDDVLFSVKKEGYAFNSTYIAADDTTFNAPLKLDVQLSRLEVNKSFNLKDIHFDHNSFEIKNVARSTLLYFADYLNDNPNVYIEINGFTDAIGDAEDNQLLSENRAKAVCDLIIAGGVARERIAYKGYGEQFPIDDNATEEGRANNRRTTFKIIKQ